MKRVRYCQLPSVMNITGRTSSITNAFFNAIIPVVVPTHEEEIVALRILEIEPSDIRCAYCGDKATEWDHLRPLITNQKPTGYITEIANLVPSCGKCNQSKGKSYWRTWMLGPARLSPKSRNISDLDQRVTRLQKYEDWRQPLHFEFEQIAGATIWDRHISNWQQALRLLKESQKVATEIRTLISESVVVRSRAAGSVG